MVEVQGHVENACVPRVESLAVVHIIPQEAVKEGKAYGLGFGGHYLGPDGWNYLSGFNAIYVMEVISNGGQDPLY